MKVAFKGWLSYKSPFLFESTIYIQWTKIKCYNRDKRRKGGDINEKADFSELNEIKSILKEHGQILGLHSEILGSHSEILKEHGQILSALRTGQEEIKAALDGFKLQNA